MANPRFDTVSKVMFEGYPQAHAAMVDIQATSLRIVDADISTISGAADKVVIVESPERFGLHFEFDAGARPDRDSHAVMCNAVLRHRHQIAFKTVVVLLRPAADGPHVTGGVHDLNDTTFKFDVSYLVFRVWEHPPEFFLNCGLGTAPLATVAAMEPGQLPDVVRRVTDRIRAEAAPNEIAELFTATFVTMGLRHPPHVVSGLMAGVSNMRESSTYQLILEEGRSAGLDEGRKAGLDEGRVRGERDVLLRLGERRFGPPDATTRQAIEQIKDPTRLMTLADRVLDATGWDDLLRA